MKKNGYIALTSAVIISLIIITIALALSFTSFFSRFSILDSEYKEIGNDLAGACAETSLLKLATNKTYSGNENIMINSNSCFILPIETVSQNKVIKTKSSVQGFVTNLKVTVNASTLDIVSWEEVPNL